MRYVLAILGAAFLAGAAYQAGRGHQEVKTTTVVVGVPAKVEATRAAIVAAVKSHDADALRALARKGAFSYAVGGDSSGDPIAYWNGLEAKGRHPYAALQRILSLPPTLRQGHYVWPFAYGLPKSELTGYERGLLGDLTRSYAGDDYYGWRAGIKPDGTWQFFVEGD